MLKPKKNAKSFSTFLAGGTDIISCFASSISELPVYRGQIQYRNLGMAVCAYDSNGM